MFIVPISSNINIAGINPIKINTEKELEVAGEQGDLGFKEVFQDMMKNVEQTDAQTKKDAYNLSIGNMDDMHTMLINAAKADVALQTLMQMRNKFLDAYSEVMRTNI